MDSNSNQPQQSKPKAAIDLVNRLQEEGKAAERRAAEKKKIEEQAKIERQRKIDEEAKIVRLPLWPEPVRSVPNAVLRGSLFAAIQEKTAKHVQDLILHDTDKLKIKYTGKRLTQSNLDVWEHALHLAKDQCLGHKIYFTEHGFLKALGRKTSAREYEWLRSVLKNLAVGTVEINHQGMTYIGSLLHDYYRDDESGESSIVINPRIARLYDAGHSYVQLEDRRKVGTRKPLALWLHGYISTHAKWYPHKVSTLRELSGSETKQIKCFKQNLKQALGHLLDLGLIESYRVDSNNLVHVGVIPLQNNKNHPITTDA